MRYARRGGSAQAPHESAYGPRRKRALPLRCGWWKGPSRVDTAVVGVEIVLLGVLTTWLCSAVSAWADGGRGVRQEALVPLAASSVENDTGLARVVGDPARKEGVRENTEGVANDGGEAPSRLTKDDDYGDELLIFEALPIVISSSRQARPTSQTSVPVSVITADDIHYSGLTAVPDILRFALGVDVLEVDRNRFAVGVRGLHHSFAERTLFLLNGRDAGSPVFGGVDFSRLPLLLEDIDRIEIVRGPTGAAWGANAFNGSVNVITKSPADVQGALAATTVDEFGDTYSHIRWGGRAHDWQWRLSVGYEDRKSSEDALDADDFTAGDFSRNVRLDSEAGHRLSKDTEITLGWAYSHVDRGSFEFASRETTDSEDIDVIRAHLRMDHRAQGGGSGYLQWFGNFEDTARPTLYTFVSEENDLEGQWNWQMGSGQQLSAGGNVRWTHLDFANPTATQTHFAEEPLDQRWVGAFLLDRWQIAPRVAVEGQARGDWFSESGADWSARLAGFYNLDAALKHVLRVSFARSFREPLPAISDPSGQAGKLPSPPFPPKSFAFTLRQADDLNNETAWAIEGGYQGTLAKGLTLRADAFYQSYADLITTRRLASPPVQVVQFANSDGADAVGTEIELRLSRARWVLSAWYAHEDFEPDDPRKSLRAFLPARNKTGINGRLRCRYGLVLNTAYRYTDITRPTPAEKTSVEPSHRWDVTLAKEFAGRRGEILVGVRDVLDDVGGAIVEGGTFTGHRTPARTIFGRLQLQF